MRPQCELQPCKMLEQGFVLVSGIDVDAGIVWVGDPCYILPDERDDEPGFEYMNVLAQWPRKKTVVKDETEFELHYRALLAGGVSGATAKRMAEAVSTRTYDDYVPVGTFAHKAGNPGRGVCVHAGYGDGSYPVWVRYENDADFGLRVAEVRVVFIPEVGDTNGHTD